MKETSGSIASSILDFSSSLLISWITNQVNVIVLMFDTNNSDRAKQKLHML